MRKLKLVLLLIICPVSLFGQDYLPMLQENTVWSIMHEKHAFIGDTIINELTYKKLYFHNYLEEFTPDSLEYIAALREDDTNEKVYFIWKGHEEELLLYDFSLEVGSELIVRSPMFFLNGPEFYQWDDRIIKVYDIFYQNIAGQERKTLKINEYHEDNPDLYPEYWIEGLGSTRGLIYAGIRGEGLIMDSEYAFLLCIHEAETLIYQEDDPWGVTVDTCYALPSVSIEEVSQFENKIKAIPSFFKESFVIQSETPIEKITVFNIMGKTVFEFHSNDYFTQKTISTSHWNKGLYIVKTENQYGSVSLKIVKY